jgi:hypothetical protein
MIGLDPNMAQEFVRLLTGSADTPMLFRFIEEPKPQGRKPNVGEAVGPVATAWPRLEAANKQGYAVYAVVNEGAGYADSDITAVRALFADKDCGKHRDHWYKEFGDERGAATRWQDVNWHFLPDFIVSRADEFWHAYWMVPGLPVEAFSDAQHRLAARYGSDPAVSNAARVMRLPGTLHLKGEPTLVRLEVPLYTRERLSIADELEDIL